MIAAMELTWEEPPPTQAGRPARYEHVLRALRERPGQWAHLDVPKLKNPSQLAASIKSGRIYGSAPKGSYDACTRTIDGATHLYVRYLGPDVAGLEP